MAESTFGVKIGENIPFAENITLCWFYSDFDFTLIFFSQQIYTFHKTHQTKSNSGKKIIIVHQYEINIMYKKILKPFMWKVLASHTGIVTSYNTYAVYLLIIFPKHLLQNFKTKDSLKYIQAAAKAWWYWR